jgi:hypothetical protein
MPSSPIVVAGERRSARSTFMRTPKPFFSGSLFFSGSMSRFQISSWIGSDL